MRSRCQLRRRRLLKAALGLGLAGASPALWGQSERKTQPLPDLVEFQRLVAANRILANENVVDAFGHVSVRHPRDPDRYVMSRSRSPALVEFADLMEFEQNGDPVDAQGRRPYGERMIHGAIYESRPEVGSVVHHHAYAVLPFSITERALRPVVHTASVIGAEIPVWDIRERFGDTDLLVRTMEHGRDLANTLGGNTCLLMRGHGAVVATATVQQAVLVAFYLQVNAQILLQALGLGTPTGLSDGELPLSAATQFSPLAVDRAWEYFCIRAGVDPV